MKIAYDRRADCLSALLKEGVAVAEGDEDKPEVILDYDEHGDAMTRTRLARAGKMRRSEIAPGAAAKTVGCAQRCKGA